MLCELKFLERQKEATQADLTETERKVKGEGAKGRDEFEQTAKLHCFRLWGLTPDHRAESTSIRG
jgi:hypothetical protein